MDHSSVRGYLLALMVVAIWTRFILVSRVGGESTMTPWDVIAIRYGTAAAILFPVWRMNRRVILFDSRMLALTISGGLIYALLAFSGFKLTHATHAAILLPGFLPFTVALVVGWLIREVPDRGRWIGLAVISSGVACLAIKTFSGVSTTISGDLLMVGASLSWAIYTVLLRHWNISPLDATIDIALLTAIFYLPIYFIVLPKQIEMAGWHEIALQAIYQGIVATIVQMFLYVRTIQLIGATRLGTLMALVPALAGVLAVPLLNEPLGIWTMTGLALVSAGAWAANRHSVFTQRSKPCLT